ncbi:MAG TPA: thiamine pyrophosphate-binding protein [Burkholderiales bacterium]|nr:thiamine pyrophosphate-binding protein [Burkholderiales bacterium]
MKPSDTTLARTAAASPQVREAPAPRTGGQILIDALKVHGVDIAFGVPGESYLEVLDALHDAREKMQFIICRQEGGAAYMAEAYGKLTGRPGICMVTRGPGATNAAIGVHVAQQDSTPFILFVGQVGNDFVERDAFQEVDYRRMFGQMTKWVAQIDRADRIPEYVNRAFHTAMSGRPGPVVLALPEDMLTETASVADTAPYKRVAAHPGEGDLRKLRELLAQSKRPFVILGGSGWNAQACEDFRSFAEVNNLPVGTAFRRQDLYDNRLPNFAGDVGIGINPALAAHIKEADLILAVGTRLDEMTTGGYTLIGVPRPKQKFVHVHAGAETLGRVYESDLPIHSGMPEFAAALRKQQPITSSAWGDWTKAARKDYEAWLEPAPVPGNLDMAKVMVYLRKRLPPETIVANGAGNFAGWVHRYYPYPGFRTEVAPIAGSMGYGAPAGIAAKLVHPERPVISFCGDGDFLMNGQELATAAQYGVKVVFLVVNNGMYGTIRMHQEREHPGRVSGTDLKNPDFAALARAYGLHGEIVEKTADFEAAFERCWSATTASLIELKIDPEAITTRTTLSAIRANALKNKK